MKTNRLVASVATGMLLSLPAWAATQSDGGFSALQGMRAQALTVEEMQAISGELNAYDIAAALGAQALAATNPRLAAKLAALSNSIFANAESINAVFLKLKILTPCKVCVPQ